MNRDDDVVVHRDFRCGTCGTVMVTNRAEPGCLRGDRAHPGQYHLQRVLWSDEPCPSCETWREPVERYGADADYDGSTVVMYPALPATAAEVLDFLARFDVDLEQGLDADALGWVLVYAEVTDHGVSIDQVVLGPGNRPFPTELDAMVQSLKAQEAVNAGQEPPHTTFVYAVRLFRADA